MAEFGAVSGANLVILPAPCCSTRHCIQEKPASRALVCAIFRPLKRPRCPPSMHMSCAEFRQTPAVDWACQVHPVLPPGRPSAVSTLQSDMQSRRIPSAQCELSLPAFWDKLNACSHSIATFESFHLNLADLQTSQRPHVCALYG
jgi:hypothetical protein